VLTPHTSRVSSSKRYPQVTAQERQVDWAAQQGTPSFPLSLTHLADLFSPQLLYLFVLLYLPPNFVLWIISCCFLSSFFFLSHSHCPWSVAFPRYVPHEFPLYSTGSTRHIISTALSGLGHCFLGPNILYPLLTPSGSPTAQPALPAPYLGRRWVPLVYPVLYPQIFQFREKPSCLTSSSAPKVATHHPKWCRWSARTCDTVPQMTGVSVVPPMTVQHCTFTVKEQLECLA
jgi:hypothetical protein